MPKSPELPPDSSRRTSTQAAEGSLAPRKRRGAAGANVKQTIERNDQPEGGDPLVELLREHAHAAGPGVALSLGFHLLLLTVLAFVAIKHERPKSIPTTISGFDANGLDQPGQPRTIVPVQIETAKTEVAEVPAGKPSQAKSEKPADDSDAGVRSPLEVDVSGALGGRSFGSSGSSGKGNSGGGAPGRGEILAAQGGTASTESAVSLGLGWLSRQQRPDGHWELHQGYPDAGQLRTSTGATALALLAFLGAGHTHRDGPHKEKVGKGLKWLLGVQKKSGSQTGDFYDFDRAGDAASFYAHGQASITVCEAYAMTHDREFLQPIRDALAYICEAQHPTTGGWKYRRRSEGDLSVFGWQIMALQSARMAGLEVPQEVLERAAQFLDLVQEQQGARYRYEPDQSKSFTPAMTAEGLLCRQYLGWPRNHPAMLSGVEYLLLPENLPNWNSGRRNVYHWYYASQVLHNLQGKDWETWNAVLRDELVKSQVKGGGRVGGSWHPSLPAGAIDENADKGGRLYVTCLCLLTLEVYYRHLPLYK